MIQTICTKKKLFPEDEWLQMNINVYIYRALKLLQKTWLTSHCGARNWVTHIYISNGGGVLEDFSFAFYIHSSIFTNYSFV